VITNNFERKDIQLEDILLKLKKHKEEICKNFSVKEIGVFGSYARGTATPESDIDFFVVFDKKTLDNITGLWIYLEELFNKNIDLIHYHKRFRDSLKREIQKDIVYG
jgi:predicted nucleotidyltransferase